MPAASSPCAHQAAIPLPMASWARSLPGGSSRTGSALSFRDGSVYDETVTFSQNGVFRLEAYRLTQRGPSFPLTEVAFDRRSGRYTARTRDGKEGEVQTAGGVLEMPDDLYNGMALTLLKNLPARRNGCRPHGRLHAEATA